MNHPAGPLPSRFLSPEAPIHEVGLRDSILSIYARIFEIVEGQQPLYQVRASSHVLTLVAEILAHERMAAQHSHSEALVEKARFLMEENILGDLNVNRMGESLGVSVSHLSSVFKSYTGMTPYQYFISIKIRRAKELLENRDLTIKEVAFRLGFADQYYFSRLFRSKTGISPSRWSSLVHQ